MRLQLLQGYCTACSGSLESCSCRGTSVARLIALAPVTCAPQVVYGHFEALQATLVEMEALVTQQMDTGDWETAAALWNWKDPDRELFLKQVRATRARARPNPTPPQQASEAAHATKGLVSDLACTTDTHAP